MRGKVEAILPKRMYTIRLDDGRVVRGSLGVKAARGIVMISEGDAVEVSESSRDPNRVRIISKI